MAPQLAHRNQSNQHRRVIVYFQTQHKLDGSPCSILPLITNSNISVTHVNVAAIHLNDQPGNITLNDHEPSHPRFLTMWEELQALQSHGIKILGMLGGAAKGSFAHLDSDETTFEQYYGPLKKFITERKLDGLDLDVEESMSLAGIIRLIDRLKEDFGNDFLITLAPVAAALMSDEPKHNLSGFSYEALEVMRGKQIAWYNTQFYCGWGDMSRTTDFERIIERGYPVEKVVVGLVTSPLNGSGWVPIEILEEVLINLQLKFARFAGVMGWEYFNPLAEDRDRPWKWAAHMTRILGKVPAISVSPLRQKPLYPSHMLDDDLTSDVDAQTPTTFEYVSESDTEASN